MNRRNFIKLLGAIPALAFLKPEVPETSLEGFIEASGNVLLEETKPVVEAMQLAIGPDNSLYIGGAFVIPRFITRDEYLARWNEFNKSYLT